MAAMGSSWSSSVIAKPSRPYERSFGRLDHLHLKPLLCISSVTLLVHLEHHDLGILVSEISKIFNTCRGSPFPSQTNSFNTLEQSHMALRVLPSQSLQGMARRERCLVSNEYGDVCDAIGAVTPFLILFYIMVHSALQ